MTIIDGQIETLKELKKSLSKSGLTRLNSVADIRRFLDEFEAEKRKLRGGVESELDAEIETTQRGLDARRQAYDELEVRLRSELEQQIQELESEIRLATEKGSKNFFFRVRYLLKIPSLSRRASRLKRSLDRTVSEKLRAEEKEIAGLARKLESLSGNRENLVSERYRKALDELTRTKAILDGLYPLVAGAIGEASVVRRLQYLSDDYYLINDFSMKFDPPVYNKKARDRIQSVQIDHLLVCQSGLFILETKNWSEASVNSLDLRSPVEQILRTSFALFVLLNSDSRRNAIKHKRHHWGDRKIPIRNIIVMTNAKPKGEFRHVKVLSLNELIGYIQYFDPVLGSDDVRSIFEQLKGRMRRRA